MARGIRTVAIRFLGDTKDLQRAGGEGEKAMGRWQKAFKRLDRAANRTLLGLGAAITGAVVKMASAGEQIAVTARNAGVNAEEFQELKFAFDQLGVGADQVGPAMRRLNRRLGLAAEGTGAAVKAFDLLNISVRDSSGEVRDTTPVLEEALQKLSGIEVEAERAALASQLFGEDAGPALAAALSGGIESLDKARQTAHELGVVMDKDALDASENFASSMAQLKATGAGLIRDFATPFLEVFTNDIVPVLREEVLPAVKRFGDFISENRTLVLTIAGALAALAGTIKVISGVIKVVTAIQWLWNVAITANPIGAIIVAVAALIAGIVLLITHWDTARNAIVAAWNVILQAFTVALAWIVKTFWTNGLKVVIDAVVGAIQWMGDQWDAAFTGAISLGMNVLDFITSLPQKFRQGLSRLRSILSAPFRAAFNFIAGIWNATVGQLQWTVPSWVPGGIGGNTVGAPILPKFHEGGMVPGRIGEETLALVRAGERIDPRGSRPADNGDLMPGQQQGTTVNVDRVEVQAWNERFNLPQVMRELALAGAV